jgi:hypothetical protein
MTSVSILVAAGFNLGDPDLHHSQASDRESGRAILTNRYAYPIRPPRFR